MSETREERIEKATKCDYFSRELNGFDNAMIVRIKPHITIGDFLFFASMFFSVVLRAILSHHVSMQKQNFLAVESVKKTRNV